MKKINSSIGRILLVFGASILFGALNQGCNYPVEYVNGNINSHTTWNSNTIYVIGEGVHYVNALLTIKPGAIVKFSPGSSLTLGQGGKIIAKGTYVERVVFTSIKDDLWGGDTNADGDMTKPARKDWLHIDTNGANGSVFERCVFSYGGAGSYSSTLKISSGSIATVRDCEFSNNAGKKYTGEGALDAYGASSGTVIEGNNFWDNTLPLSINTAVSIDDSNQFHSTIGGSTNKFNGIYVWNPDHIKGKTIWEETEVAFVIDGSFWINSGAKLELGDHVVLKFTHNVTLFLKDGASAIVNRNGNGVCFTSIKDDSFKGDTNGDGSMTSPAKYDWDGIYNEYSADYLRKGNILFDSH